MNGSKTTLDSIRFLQYANIQSTNCMCPTRGAAEKRAITPRECARSIQPNSIAHRNSPM
jgi:hypothetical protein